MAYNEPLASRVREILSSVVGFSEKKMFGGLCFLIHGNMCCGVLKGDLVLRLEPEGAQELQSRPHTRPMDFTDRPMKGFVFIEAKGLATDRQLRDCVSMAHAFAQSLPRKPGGKSPSQRSTTRRAKHTSLQ
jgi:TfoX/Sxy family transcriptional regulator of competence genes